MSAPDIDSLSRLVSEKVDHLENCINKLEDVIRLMVFNWRGDIENQDTAAFIGRLLKELD